MKVVTIVGTRPEVIRLSRVIPRLDESMKQVLVHTGQNWDFRLNGIFFEEMGLRPPDHSLNVDVSSLGSVLGDVLRKTEQVLLQETPDAVLVLGDTNSAISAVIAKRLHIPVYHMEAGNRSFDENVPEETMRRLVDHVADFNLVYTEHARRNLLREGIHPRRIMLTGSPMCEVLAHYRAGIEGSDVLRRLGLDEHRFVVVSAHREENVDAPSRLESLLACLEAVHSKWSLPLIVSTHPRTKARLQAIGGQRDFAGITFHEPFGFLDYNLLQLKAFCTLSDSGTISEESSILGFPAVTLRSSIERPEALDTGSIIMSDLDPDRVIAGIEAARSDHGKVEMPREYRIGDCSVRVRNFILSTAKEHAVWSGLRTQRSR